VGLVTGSIEPKRDLVDRQRIQIRQRLGRDEDASSGAITAAWPAEQPPAYDEVSHPAHALVGRSPRDPTIELGGTRCYHGSREGEIDPVQRACQRGICDAPSGDCEREPEKQDPS
jgi:hypothetical protein